MYPFNAGDEYGIVLLSTVRSQPIAEIANPEHVQPDRGWLLENLGFLTDEHQVNVGITRSKYGLIIVGKYLTIPLILTHSTKIFTTVIITPFCHCRQQEAPEL